MQELLYFISSYLTLWNILLIVLYINNIIPRYNTNSLLLLSTFVLIGGFYIHYIKPKYMIIPYFSTNGIIVKEESLLLVDIIYHILPLIILYNYITKNNIKLNKVPTDYTLFIIILLIYNSFNSIEKRYRIDHTDCSIIYVITILIYRIIIKYNK
jgi:hypothetical protein